MFLLHPLDLIYNQEAFRGLGVPLRLAYSINRGRSWDLLDWYLATLREAGYRFAYLSELYKQACTASLPEVSL